MHKVRNCRDAPTQSGWQHAENLETGHRSKGIRAMIINSSCERNSGKCHIVVAKGRGIGTHRVKVCVCHGLLSSQAVLSDKSVWAPCNKIC